MIVCSVCKNKSMEGDFCQVCGAPLVALGIDEATGTFGGIHEIIKSKFANNDIINKVDYPNCTTRDVTIGNDETFFADDGTGMKEFMTNFTTTRNDLKCFYVKKDISFSVGLNVDMDTFIDKIGENDKIKINIKIQVDLSIKDRMGFVLKFISEKDANWNKVDIETLLSEKIRDDVTKVLCEYISKNGGLNLSDLINQFKSFTPYINDCISGITEEFLITPHNIDISEISCDQDTLFTLLINKIYNE